MRLTSQCGLFQAWVEIEDVEQDIFLARHIAGQRERMEAYVVSQPGKSYTIDVDLKRYFDQRPTTSAISNEKPFDCMSIHFRIDGNLVSRTIGKSDYSCQRISGIGISASEERPFRFVEPNLTEDGGTTRRNDTCGEGVGLIELSLVQSRKEALTAHDDTTATEAQQKMSGKLGEGSKKLVSSVTTFGALRATMPVTTYTMQYKPGQSSSQPYVRLAFRYATKEVLQAMSIIPAPAAPTFAPDATPTPTLSTSAVSQIARDEIDVDGSDEEHGRVEGSETDEEDDPVVEAERMAAKAALEADEAVLRARKAKMHAEEIAAEAKKAVRKRKRQQTQEKDDKAGDDKEKIQRKAQKRLKKLLDDAKKKDAAEIDLTVIQDVDLIDVDAAVTEAGTRREQAHDEDDENDSDEDQVAVAQEKAAQAAREAKAAALRAELAQIEAESIAAVQAKKRKRPAAAEEEDKAPIKRRADKKMSRRLMQAKEADGGVVDLTFGED